MVRADLLYDFNMEDLFFSVILLTVEDEMYQRRERVMITVFDVERLTLSRCSLADVHREKTGHCPPQVMKTMKTVCLTTPLVWSWSCCFIYFFYEVSMTLKPPV